MIVTLTTDFGDSAYAGAMKGAILRVEPAARIVDVTHGVPAHDVLQGALALYAACPYFPEGSIHVGVVDPGVGTERRGVVVETSGGLLVGPDNGLLQPAARRMGLRRVRVIDNGKLYRERASATFHGRDVFGPVAARLAGGLPPSEVGPEIEDFVPLDFGPLERESDAAKGRTLAVDLFGNVITNVPGEIVGAALRPGATAHITVAERTLQIPVARTYGDVPPGEAALLLGSAGFLEISVNRGSAAKTFGIKPGQDVRVSVRQPGEQG